MAPAELLEKPELGNQDVMKIAEDEVSRETFLQFAGTGEVKRAILTTVMDL